MTPRTSDSVLIVAAAIITVIVTVHAVVNQHQSITAEDFVLFMLVTTGAAFTVKTIAAVLWHLVQNVRRKEP